MNDLLHDVRSPGWVADADLGVAVLLHGFGSNERDLTGLVAPLGLTLPWVSLRAPIELGNGGAAWFTITTPGNPEPQPVMDATDEIWRWIDAEVDPAVPIVPIGFSQGGLMATQLLRTRPDRVPAAVVLGGFVLGAPQVGDGDIAVRRPPLFWGRGAEDHVIAASAVARTSSFLPRHTALVERVYAGLGHGINGAEIDDIRDFLTVNVRVGAVTPR
jgi:phospholipase/carboxylesterase